MWQWKNGREGGCGRRERPQLSHTVNDDDDYNCCFVWKQAVGQQHTTAPSEERGEQLVAGEQQRDEGVFRGLLINSSCFLRMEVPSPCWLLVAWTWCLAARSWRGADSSAGGAEGDGGERQELQLSWKMSE